MAAIARRRKLLNNDVIISLADSSWEILDLSGSDVSDFGLAKVAEMCKSLRAVDIRYENSKFCDLKEVNKSITETVHMQPMQQNYCQWCIRTCTALPFIGDIEMRVNSHSC